MPAPADNLPGSPALQGILANEEKMMDSALGGKADPRAMRRLGGAAGGGAGPTY